VSSFCGAVKIPASSSLSTWENQAAIDKYRASEAHKAIQQHTRALMNVTKVEVKTYDVVG
jgi:heme-degrading monooxygenase HmoA